VAAAEIDVGRLAACHKSEMPRTGTSDRC